MSESESDACATLLAGVTIPIVETCPNLTVSEVVQLEYEGKPVWEDLQRDDNGDQERSFRLFVCLVILGLNKSRLGVLNVGFRA